MLHHSIIIAFLENNRRVAAYRFNATRDYTVLRCKLETRFTWKIACAYTVK